MQVTNLAYFYERSRKVRGGKWVWVKDSNGEGRKNVLLGGTILNPKKGFDHLYAAQLAEYIPGEGVKIFRSFLAHGIKETNMFTIDADGYSDIPEVGMILVNTDNIEDTNTSLPKITVASVTYNAEDNVFVCEFEGDAFVNNVSLLVEGDSKTATEERAHILVTNPNTFIEADRDLPPTEGYGLDNEANISISTVYDKQAWIERMQPLPEYVLKKNRSYIEGIFWI